LNVSVFVLSDLVHETLVDLGRGVLEMERGEDPALERSPQRDPFLPKSERSHFSHMLPDSGGHFKLSGT